MDSSSGKEIKRKKAYIDEKAYRDAIISKPDIVVFMLGTNDSKTHNWDEKNFRKDYLSLVNKFKGLTGKSGHKCTLYLMIPPPVYEDRFKYCQ